MKRYGFVATTAQYTVWAASKLQLRSRLVLFRYVKGSHTGEHLGELHYEVFGELGVRHKVC
jgi:hypothetical protein